MRRDQSITLYAALGYKDVRPASLTDTEAKQLLEMCATGKRYRAAWHVARRMGQPVTGRLTGWEYVLKLARRYATRHGSAADQSAAVMLSDMRQSLAKHIERQTVTRGSPTYCAAYAAALARYGAKVSVTFEEA